MESMGTKSYTKVNVEAIQGPEYLGGPLYYNYNKEPQIVLVTI